MNEDTIEELFGYSAGNKNNLKDKELLTADPSPQHISLLNVKKSCNLAVVFKAMNIRVQEIHDALIEGIYLFTRISNQCLNVACFYVFKVPFSKSLSKSHSKIF